jgi:hypothetical protein
MLFLIIVGSSFLSFPGDLDRVSFDQIGKLLLFHSNHVELKLCMHLNLHAHHLLLLDQYDVNKNSHRQYILDQHENVLLY